MDCLPLKVAIVERQPLWTGGHKWRFESVKDTCITVAVEVKVGH